MKSKVLLRVLLLSAAVAAFVIPSLAQDSATIAQVQQIAGVADKWPIGAKIIAALAIVSELLALVPSNFLPANGILDAIIKVITSVNWKGAAKVLLPIALIIGFSLSGHSQSLFKAIPKPATRTTVTKANPYAHSLLTVVDTPAAGKNFTGLRFTGPTVLYAVNTKAMSQSALFTCVGVDYESDTWDASSQKFYTNWAVGLQFGEGGEFAPSSVSAVTAAALTFSMQKLWTLTLPFKLTVGAIYNFTTKNAMLATGPGIPLNN